MVWEEGQDELQNQPQMDFMEKIDYTDTGSLDTSETEDRDFMETLQTQLTDDPLGEQRQQDPLTEPDQDSIV